MRPFPALTPAGWFFLTWLAALSGFAAVCVLAAGADRFAGDVWTTSRLRDIDAAAFARVLDWTEDLAGLPWVAPVWLAFTAAAFFAAGRVSGALMLAGASGNVFSNLVLKEAIARPRPSPDLVDVTERPGSYSFPSGHAEEALVLYGFAVYLAAVYAPAGWLRNTIQLACIWIVIVTGIERVYAGHHWPSDVLGGYYLGALVLALQIAAHRLVGAPRTQ